MLQQAKCRPKQRQYFGLKSIGIEITQPQVSKWSSNRIKHPDAPEDKSSPTCTSTLKRRRERNLHSFELALYTWMKQIEKQYETRVPITGDNLHVKASKLFRIMPVYKDQTEPADPMDGFKTSSKYMASTGLVDTAKRVLPLLATMKR
ncbi:hypothetical protein K3495_g2872 [Podosphaera aphanis]|nr:hypothetical protein K3495_g2872 [Podosphaera aphanis]